MKRFAILWLLGAALPFLAAAQGADSTQQQSRWKYKGLTGFNLSQTALSEWSGGGENTIAANVYFNGQLNYKRGNIAWDNLLSTEFGMLYTKTSDWQKSADKLQFTSKLGYTRNDRLFGSLLIDFLTQYTDGYKSPADENYISRWMSPGYLNIALGIDYKTSIFTFFYSPLTDRLTFVLDDSLSRAGAFGVTPGDRLKAEMGMYAKAGMDWQVTGQVKIISTLDLFSSYRTLGNVVVQWETLMSMKVTKYLTATLNFSLKYDDAVKTFDSAGNERGPKVQLKEMLGLGVSYSF